MEYSKPWKADPAPVNYAFVLCRLLFKSIAGLAAAFFFSSPRPDPSQATTESVGGFSPAFIRNVVVSVISFIVTTLYAVDDVLLLARSIRPKTVKVDSKKKQTETKPKFDITELMGSAMAPVTPQPTRSLHGLSSPSNFSPEPPRTSPAMIQSLAGKLAGSLSRRKVQQGVNVAGGGGAGDGFAAEEVSDGGTWEESPFRNENLPPYGQYRPDASLGEGIPKYHYSLAWTQVDSRGVMKPVLSMRSQPWKSDKHVSVDRHTLWTFSERAREWVVEHVLQSFVQRLASVSASIKKHKLGLPPLLPEDRDWHALRPDAAIAAGHLQYCASALDGIKRQLQQAQQASASFQSAQQAQQLAQLREQHKVARQHMQILRDYQGLCKVLQGALPGVALGTPVPPAVLAKRVALLAESCCLSPSPEHDQAAISDCEVVLYLAGAFLQAPFWRFEALTEDSASDAFQVVASANALTSRRMAFVLASTAGDVSNVEAGIEFCHRGLGGQQSWTQQQAATLIVRGIRCFERSGSWACFELLALFFALVEAEFGGKIGYNGLQYLNASAIVAPVKLPRQEAQWSWSRFFQ